MEPAVSSSISLAEYNIAGSLEGLGKELFLSIVHDMTAPADISTFLQLTKRISEVTKQPLFSWAESPAAANSYSIQAVPIEKVDFVCYYCS